MLLPSLEGSLVQDFHNEGSTIKLLQLDVFNRDALDIDQTAFTLENSSHEIQVPMVQEDLLIFYCMYFWGLFT